MLTQELKTRLSALREAKRNKKVTDDDYFNSYFKEIFPDVKQSYKRLSELSLGTKNRELSTLA